MNVGAGQRFKVLFSLYLSFGTVLYLLTLNNSFITIFTPLDKTVYVEIVPVESMLHHNKTP